VKGKTPDPETTVAGLMTRSMAKSRVRTTPHGTPNDNGSQFYICVANSSGLDQTYTVFGEVFPGMEVVDKIAAAVRDDRDNPLETIPIKVIPAGRSKRLSAKAEESRAAGQLFPEGYVEDCDEPGTKLAILFRNLPVGCSNRLSSKAAAEEQAAGVPSGVR
jgi:hypothetical protein